MGSKKTANRANLKWLANALSLLRLCLSVCFLWKSLTIRALAVAGALITDVLDGYIARRFNAQTQFGAVLDPLADKVFVGAAVVTFFFEGHLEIREILAFFCRDLSVLAFALCLFFKGRLHETPVEAFILGKIVTALQFVTLALLSLGVPVPTPFFFGMAFFGLLSFWELERRQRKMTAILKNQHELRVPWLERRACRYNQKSTLQ
jgi:CDP-diacylglycerol--glycerol-3-phosphate 3-phosphatidyltransferase